MSDLKMKDLSIRHAAGLIFLIDRKVKGGVYHRPIIINEVGEEIFLLLADGMDISSTAKTIAKRYDIDVKTAEQDVTGFIDGVRNGYIEWR